MTRAILTFCALLSLGACSSTTGTDEPSISAQIFDATRALATGADGSAQNVSLSDSQLRAAPFDVLLLKVPTLGSDVGLVRQSTNRDVVTWVTDDRVTVSLQRGQIVGTAGFSSDLSSASIPHLRGTATSVMRDHYRLAGDERIERIRFACTLSRRPEAVTVAGRAFATTRVDEACAAPSGERADNVYWIDGRGVVRKSRQYVSPRLGYFELQDVHSGLR